MTVVVQLEKFPHIVLLVIHPQMVPNFEMRITRLDYRRANEREIEEGNNDNPPAISRSRPNDQDSILSVNLRHMCENPPFPLQNGSEGVKSKFHYLSASLSTHERSG